MSYIKTIDVNGVATQIDYTAMTNAGLISTIEGKHWTVA